MKTVYFKAIDSYSKTQEMQQSSKALLQKVVEEEQIDLQTRIPLKVHFGEKGNSTFIDSENFEGIIEYLREHHIESCFIETNALYSGQRMTREKHTQLAQEHGFTQLPVVIADGEYGEKYDDVEIHKKHFTTCKIARGITEHQQMIVLSHFKGHMLAGFGGAIKQLAMGCAARGGKLAQHSTSVPLINPFACRKCGLCAKHCPVDAIRIGMISRIDKKKCIGCASCMAVCPHHAVKFNPLRLSISKTFQEKLVEYAFAAQKGKTYVYVSFAFNITKGCDCEGRKMKPIVDDLGIFASTDPVAIDQACLDMLDQRQGKKVFSRGRGSLDYAKEIGLGNKEYQLKELQ